MSFFYVKCLPNRVKERYFFQWYWTQDGAHLFMYTLKEHHFAAINIIINLKILLLDLSSPLCFSKIVKLMTIYAQRLEQNLHNFKLQYFVFTQMSILLSTSKLLINIFSSLIFYSIHIPTTTNLKVVQFFFISILSLTSHLNFKDCIDYSLMILKSKQGLQYIAHLFFCSLLGFINYIINLYCNR